MIDPREGFVERIELSKTRVRAFEGFIFLCGGERANDPVPIRSIRHMIYHELVSGRHGDVVGRLKMAEEIQDWYRDGNFSDLVTFEEHLAGLSAVIVLVVESPGAIAELGAFAISPAISDRLLVLVAEIHYETESFIRLGPLKRLEDASIESVLVYDWHDREISGRSTERFDKLQGELPAIIEAIKGFTAPDRSERTFKVSEPAHVMFLICDLCDLFGALSYMEIHEYLVNLKLDVEAADLKRYLFLLEKCDLLRIKRLGHGRYYYPVEWVPRISFGFTPGVHVDKERLRIDVARYYEAHLKSRFEVVKKIRRSP